MREIKFRGRKKNNGEWVYGFYSKNTEGRSFILLDILVAPFDNPSTQKPSMIAYEVDPDTVGQYIELRDKNNKEIYEGDIVKVNTGINIRVRNVIFANGMFCIRGESSLLPLGRHSMESAPAVEIIGNIYENPELIKV